MPEKRRKLDPEFREDAARIVRETAKPIARMARNLWIHEGTLGCQDGQEPRVVAEVRSVLADVGVGARPLCRGPQAVSVSQLGFDQWHVPPADATAHRRDRQGRPAWCQDRAERRHSPYSPMVWRSWSGPAPTP
jgi:hypothetical protein